MRGSGPAPVFRDHRKVVGAAPIYGLQRRFKQEVLKLQNLHAKDKTSNGGMAS